MCVVLHSILIISPHNPSHPSHPIIPFGGQASRFSFSLFLTFFFFSFTVAISWARTCLAAANTRVPAARNGNRSFSGLLGIVRDRSWLLGIFPDAASKKQPSPAAGDRACGPSLARMWPLAFWPCAFVFIFYLFLCSYYLRVVYLDGCTPVFTPGI